VMRKSFKLKSAICTLLALLALAGCGYHPVTTHSPLMDANGVNVTLFANRSYRPGVEGILARDLVDELALRTGGKVLPGDEAQLELGGVIISYATYPVSYTSKDIIKEYRTVVGIQAVLRDKQSQKVLWKSDLSGEQTFPVNPNIALQQNSEEAATRKICRNLAQQIWQKMGERF
jgi:outer membrane lipopolysaccharide assembly protein LptE/RlpB